MHKLLSLRECGRRNLVVGYESNRCWVGVIDKKFYFVVGFCESSLVKKNCDFRQILFQVF